MALGALLYQGGVAAYQSAPLELKEIRVEGNSGKRVSDDQIVVASEVEVGAHLLRVSIRAVERKISEIAWVASVKVERLLPSTLRIVITERRPRVLVQTSGGPFLVDGNGAVLQEGTENLIQILELPLSAIKPGDTISVEEFIHANSILSSLPRDLRVSVVSMKAASIDQITLRMSDGVTIFYGAAEQIEEKNFALEALIMTENTGLPGEAAVIDVRAPSRPTVRSS